MLAPPVIRGSLAVRLVWLVVGLALFSFGIVLMLEAELGLSPWDVLNQGLSELLPISFGMANVCVALVVLVGAWRLGARIGVGTVANAILVGTFVDVLIRLGWLDGLSDASLGVRVALLALGIAVIGLGSGLYIGAALGAGPRDSLMLVLAFRTGTRVGVVRAGLEIAATAAGFALGGTVGVGTLAFALGIGPAVELGFWVVGRTPLAEPAAASGAL